MRGSKHYQAQTIVDNILAIGQSKKLMKTSEEYSVPHLKGGLKTSPYIHSYKSRDEVFKRCIDLFDFAQKNYGKKDLQAITGEEVKAFVQSKVDKGLKERSIATYISQLEKIRFSLSLMPKNEKRGHLELFTREDLVECKAIAKTAQKSDHKNRAYRDPLKLIDAITDEKCKIVAEIQCKYGLRISEARKLNEKNFIDENTIKVKGKGGYEIIKTLAEDLVKRIKAIFVKEKKLLVTEKVYSEALKKASKESRQRYQGSHGLRYNYAQNEYAKLLIKGYEPLVAQKMVSEEMGHHRADITMHYIKETKIAKKTAKKSA